jgi:flagellar FliJ protein
VSRLLLFQFRFASILQLRRQQRDEAGAAVGQANEAIRRVDDQIKSIGSQRHALREGAGDNRIGSVSVDTLLADGRYDLQLEADMQALQKTRSELFQELERRQAVLIAAESEVKRFERLEGKERAAFNAEASRREQAAADEATARRYTIERQR